MSDIVSPVEALEVRVDLAGAGSILDPYWKRVMNSDRTGLSLRRDVQEHIAAVVGECGLRNLRQHGVFWDDVAIWPRAEGPLQFGYVDAVYDYYLSLGLRPFVELSFLPRWMASDDKTIFAVLKAPACPPRDLAEWRTLVRATLEHWRDRYGLDEIRSWHFEVWNEANIPFWSGTQQQYFELYRASVEAVKGVDSDLRIGGPASSNCGFDPATNSFQPPWVEDFLVWCEREKLPVDFVATHPYPTNFPFMIGKGHYPVAREREATCTDLTTLRRLVQNSAYPEAAIHADEWSSAPGWPMHVHDHAFAATFTLENVLNCLGLADSLARWALSDVSEEVPPTDGEFCGGWGLVTRHGVRKPVFYAYAFLHALGETLLLNEPGICVCRGSKGWQVLLYNHHHYSTLKATWETWDGAEAMIGPGTSREFKLDLTGLPPRIRVRRSLVDASHGNARSAWVEMGSPPVPTPRQVDHLHQASTPSVTEKTVITSGGWLELSERLDPLAMMLIEIEGV